MATKKATQTKAKKAVKMTDKKETPAKTETVEKAAAPMGGKFKRKAAITLPTTSFKERDILYCKVVAEIRTGKAIKRGSEDMEPAELMRIIDLETGEEVDLIVPAVLGAILSDMKEEGKDYVGMAFEIQKQDAPGKRYKKYSVYEIDAG